MGKKIHRPLGEELHTLNPMAFCLSKNESKVLTKMKLNQTIQGNCEEVIKTFPDEFVDCVVTSPPYFGLRNYGREGQIGLEDSPEEYVQRLVNLFRDVKRVLKPLGTLWLNLGDSYAGSFTSHLHKSKDLIGIPWMVAFALRADGWYLRQDIIWSKPNPMPESVRDRCTKAHEYIFLLSKSPRYYYDHESIKTDAADATVRRMLQDVYSQNGSDRVPGKRNGRMKAVMSRNPRKEIDVKGGNQGRRDGIPPMAIEGTIHKKRVSAYMNDDGSIIGGGKANKKSVWTVPTKGLKEAHFATFPEELIVDCIKAGCPPEGIVLDPFHGAGTTGLVASKLGRNFIGIELNDEYRSIEDRRRYKNLGLFK